MVLGMGTCFSFGCFSGEEQPEQPPSPGLLSPNTGSSSAHSDLEKAGAPKSLIVQQIQAQSGSHLQETQKEDLLAVNAASDSMDTQQSTWPGTARIQQAASMQRCPSREIEEITAAPDSQCPDGEDPQSLMDDEATVMTTMTLSDMPHFTIDQKLAEKARINILYDRDDNLGRMEVVRQTNPNTSFPDQVEQIGQTHGRNQHSLGRHELQPGDDLDPNEIYFLSDGNSNLQKLGKGAFGTVYKGIWQGTTVAVKVCRERSFTEKSMQVFYKEISILRSCRHPHIVQLKGACSWKGGKRTVLVTEYMENGDLCNALGRWPELFSWEYGIGRRVAFEVAQGLAFLHAHNIVHFDLKSGNVLLDRWNTAKVADVGLAKRLVNYHGTPALSTFCRTEEFGTYAWAAPEVIVGAPCTTAADIFSFGVLLFELLTTELPEGRRLRPIRVPQEGPQEAADLVRACCLTNPSARPTASALVEILQLMQ